MDECRPSFRSSGGERRLEIVSGNQMYSSATRAYSPENRSRVNRVSQVAASSPAKLWGFSDPEMKRRNRIAKYNVYTIEGRFKASFKNGFRWIKNKCAEFIHGC